MTSPRLLRCSLPARCAAVVMYRHVRAQEYADTFTVFGQLEALHSELHGPESTPRPEVRFQAGTHWHSVGVRAVCERHAQQGAPSRKTGGHRPQDRLLEVSPDVFPLSVSSRSFMCFPTMRPSSWPGVQRSLPRGRGTSRTSPTRCQRSFVDEVALLPTGDVYDIALPFIFSCVLRRRVRSEGQHTVEDVAAVGELVP